MAASLAQRSIAGQHLAASMGGAAAARRVPTAPARRAPRRAAQRAGSHILCASYDTLKTSREMNAGPGAQLSLELPTGDVQQSVELTVLKRKRSGNAIVVLDVQPGSASWEAGVRPGQQVLAISDPIRVNEVWELNRLASLNYVRQAIGGRAADFIIFRVSPEPIPEWEQAAAAAASAAAAGADQKEELRAQFEKMQEAAVQAKRAERERKLEIRKSYEEENSEAVDSNRPVLFGLALAFFVGVPLTVLAVISATGYIDQLAPGRTF